jgi:hypothetical protein
MESEAKIVPVRINFINLFIIFIFISNIKIVIKLGELSYQQTKNTIPNWLQFKINQFILNNTENYDSACKSFTHKIENTEIYNTPNNMNSIDSLSMMNIDDLEKKDNLTTDSNNKKVSIFAVDHLKYKGLERIFDAEKIEKLEKLDSRTRNVFVNFDKKMFH